MTVVSLGITTQLFDHVLDQLIGVISLLIMRAVSGFDPGEFDPLVLGAARWVKVVLPPSPFRHGVALLVAQPA